MSESREQTSGIALFLVVIALGAVILLAILGNQLIQRNDRDAIMEAAKDAVCAKLAQTGPVDCDSWKATTMKDAQASIVMEGDNKADVQLSTQSGMGIDEVVVVKDTDGNWRPE